MLEAILFITGAGVMILEITGSRLLAPYIGTSIFAWTSLIGVILGNLSIGYWLGGKRADKNPQKEELARIVFFSGAAILLILLIRNPVFELFRQIEDLRLRAPLSAIVLFAIPSILLGAVTPYTARLKLHQISSSGSTVGLLYATSTIGSIAGTFFAGFYLIPTLGVKTILIGLGIVIAISGIILHPKKILEKTSILLFLFIFSSTINLQASSALLRNPENFSIESNADTAYNNILILREKKFEGSPRRYLMTDPAGVQTAMFIDKPNEIVSEYIKFYRLGGYFIPNITHALMIGGGGYAYPKDFINKFGEATIDVVEIDPAITDLAKKFFELPDNPHLVTYNEDGRVFINNSPNNKYDAIFVDAFNGCVPPHHLSTREAAEKMHEALKERGVVIVNLIGSVIGENGEFVRREYATYRSIFPWVYLFTVTNPDPSAMQNIMLIAVKEASEPQLASSDPEINGYLARRWTGEIQKEETLTDDYAPIEYFSKNICSKSFI